MLTPRLLRSRTRLLVGGLITCAINSVVAAETLEDLQKAASALAQTRSETTQLVADWSWQRDAMQSSIDALEEQTRLLEDRRAFLEAKHSADDQKARELSDDVASARTRLDAFEKHLEELTAKVLEMRSQLPPRLSRAIELPCRSLADPDISPGERMQYLTNVWKRCLEFNHAISLAEETIQIEGQPTPRVLEVMYWGAGLGYALDRNSDTAYLGRPGPAGWTWEAKPELASRVSKLIAIYHDQADPEYISMPVQANQAAVEAKP